jgi:nucleoside-diphosphate-sugar epimerase
MAAGPRGDAMRVLITGGAGYLGSVLGPVLLARQHKVRVLDSLRHGVNGLRRLMAEHRIEFVTGDIRSTDAVVRTLAGVDAVVHLAAIVGDPACARPGAEAMAINYQASVDLFALAAEQGIARVVFASTCSNYGRMASDGEYVDEDAPLRPVSLYAESKVQVESRLLDPRTPKPPVWTILRFATLYGLSDRMRFDLTVNEFTATLMAGQTLTVFGDQFWRPYVHVRDAAEAIVTVLEAPPDRAAGHVFNVGSTAENYRKADIVRLLLDRLPQGSVEVVHRDEDPRDYKVSCDKIHARLGFRPRLTVPDGIGEIVDAFRAGRFENYQDATFRN